MPLVSQAFNWAFGVYAAATMGSEMTAAAFGQLGQVRRDPFAMLPFCGYHMGDYFGHWLDVRRAASKNKPRIFNVNWFRRDKDGKFALARLRREHARAEVDRRPRARPARRPPKAPLGWMPRYEDLDWRGLKFSEAAVRPRDDGQPRRMGAGNRLARRAVLQALRPAAARVAVDPRPAAGQLVADAEEGAK